MKDRPTGLMISPVPLQFLDALWDQAASVLVRSVATAGGKFNVHDVYAKILMGEYVLWIVVDYDKEDEIVAAITTRIIVYPNGTSMAMDWIGGTRMREWLPMAQEVISSYARDHGCMYLEGYGRKGWDRWLRRYGWQPDYIAYKMELN